MTSVSDAVPMKRELKVVIGSRYFFDDICFRRCPYEEGTESPSKPSIKAFLLVSDAVPMKRELKVRMTPQWGWFRVVSDAVPMKRELKVLPYP